ncbi:maleylacetoacetate isomerase [Kordiimonas pumila]|uniref:Maleylacetoacetate isomerase n=1 Tax=Kordiimonas pumila TaxID=2161677 RepID=A0ABV7D581_9PROT|nr:maleylacetoacetate isomerase [Kordiimonas pumila]
MTGMVLHNYYRSSTSYRVRAALNLKQVPYAYKSYHLRKGEQKSKAFLKLNPEGLVPALELPDGKILTQSMAIIEWLDEEYPEPKLMPADALGRARVRSLAQAVACDVHPINNLRVLGALKARFNASDDDVADWFSTWVHACFEPYEKRLSTEAETGNFCHGDTPTLADICLVAQVINNARFSVCMDSYPIIQAIYERCMEIDAFQQAKPMLQPDAE